LAGETPISLSVARISESFIGAERTRQDGKGKS
jgi:hypothetical protein